MLYKTEFSQREKQRNRETEMETESGRLRD